ncbi:MAG: hypothetical protein AABM29_01595 [Actinomycetota bacterium]
MRAAIAPAVAFAALVLAACGGDGDSSSDGSGAGAGYGAVAQKPATDKPATDKPATDGPGTAKPGTTIKAADSEYGEILFDGDQRAIYLFDKEQSPRSECYGACAEAWPPVLTKGKPQAGGGAQGSMLGTTRRDGDDGSVQVTYDGHPLYYYVDDPPGEVLCHNVVEFGGLWLVVQPNGDAVS